MNVRHQKTDPLLKKSKKLQTLPFMIYRAAMSLLMDKFQHEKFIDRFDLRSPNTLFLFVHVLQFRIKNKIKGNQK